MSLETCVVQEVWNGKVWAARPYRLVRDDGETLSAQLTREQVEGLELQAGQIVYVRPMRQTVFAD